MLARLRQTLARTPDTNIYLGDRRARELRQAIRDASGKPVADQCKLYFDLADAELRLGREEQALETYATCRQLLAQISERIPAERTIKMVFQMGVANMRFGETQNCVFRKRSMWSVRFRGRLALALFFIRIR